MKTFVLLASLAIGGCSSIDRSSDIDDSRFVLGESTKQDVIAAIGLPNKVERRDENEFWIYSGKEIHSNFFVPLPVAATSAGPNTYKVYYTDIGPKTNYEFEPVMVCVFGPNMILINAFDPRTKEAVK